MRRAVAPSSAAGLEGEGDAVAVGRERAAAGRHSVTTWNSMPSGVSRSSTRVLDSCRSRRSPARLLAVTPVCSLRCGVVGERDPVAAVRLGALRIHGQTDLVRCGGQVGAEMCIRAP